MKELNTVELEDVNGGHPIVVVGLVTVAVVAYFLYIH